jgi:hypothetical protein
MICKHCNDEIDPVFGCWCMRVNGVLPEQVEDAVYAPRTVSTISEEWPKPGSEHEWMMAVQCRCGYICRTRDEFLAHLTKVKGLLTRINSLGGHLGASEASFEKGWHPELDAGMETS